jgi:hypothetical protein
MKYCFLSAEFRNETLHFFIAKKEENNMKNEKRDPLYFVKFTSNEVEEAVEYEERRKKIAEERAERNHQAVIYSRLRLARNAIYLITGLGASIALFWCLIIGGLMGSY